MIKKEINKSKLSKEDWSRIKERDIVNLALGGVHFDAAMVELWNRYKKRLYLYIKYKINFSRTSQEAQEKYVIEDILQNTFIDVLENLSLYNPQFEVSTWIYNITNKFIVRYIREIQKFQNTTDAYEDVSENYHLSSDVIKPDESCELKEFERIVTLFVQSLKIKDDQEVFLLYLQNLHTRNISDLLHKTQDAVRARLNRVMKKFKRYLEKNYPEYLTANILSQIKNLNFSFGTE